MIGAMVVMATSFKRTYASMPHLLGLLQSVSLARGRPVSTQVSAEDSRNSQASLAQSLTGSLLLSSGSWYLQDFVCVLEESLFPQSCGSSVIKSHWCSKSNSLGVLGPFGGSPGW